jgi:nucleoid-associated protein YgaU
MTNPWSVLLVSATLVLVGCESEDEPPASVAVDNASPESREADQSAAAEQEAAEKAAAEQEAAEKAAAEQAAREAAERVAAEARRSHTVQAGDCLWCIAEERWGDGYRWNDVYEANRELVEDPDLIYPGQVLKMPSDG